MASSSVLLLLQLLLMVSAASAWYYSYLGGSVTFRPKGRNSDGTYEVELRDHQTAYYCYGNSYTCSSGDCGSQTQTSSSAVAANSYGLNWCDYEVTTNRQVAGNLPFSIRYPSYYNMNYGNGYWVSNVRNSMGLWRMTAHVDLGTRSDTGQSNQSPVTAVLPILRVPQNCPRSFNLTVFDPDGDRVRCRVPTSSSTDECGLCGLTSGLSFDEGSCSIAYKYSGLTGYYPVELVVEDFPNKEITVSYSDGSYTLKRPLSMGRYRRQLSITTPYPTTTTATPYPTTATTTTTPYTTTITASTTTTHYPTTTPFPTTTATTTLHPTTTAATTTPYPTTTTATTTPYPTTTTTPYPTTTTASTTPYPTTTTTPYPTTTTATTTPYPTTTTATTTPYPTTTTTPYPTTTTASTTPYPTTTTTPYPTTTTPTTTTATTTPYPTTTTTTPYPTTTTTPYPTTTTTPYPTTTPYRTSIAALSKLPLQFSVLVDYHQAPSCLDGDYIPIFLSPTPVNGVNLPAFVNHTLEIRVRSTAQYTTITNLIVTGPNGISKQQIESTDTYVIKWTPTEKELNGHFTVCFVSEARDQYYQVYQSELRCVTVDVGHHETSVTCNETTIKVEVEKSYLIRRNEDNLHLNDFADSSCNLTTLSNETHLVAVIPLGSCGTLVEEDEENIIFTNEITSADPDEIISRHHDVEIAISCVYPKRTNLTLGFSHKNPYAFREKGFGAFTFQFEFFESQRFRKQVHASNYPVEVYLKQMIFMQIEATTSIPNTELFVESCRATPYDNPKSRISYTIIENGCVKDKTVQVYPSSKSVFRFGMEAFEFIGAHEEVYITCSVILCESGISGTRCSQGCIPSNSVRRLRKREAASQTSSHSISQGPLRLIRPSDSQASGLSMNMSLNLVFIVGCLLVCGVVIYRSKRSRAKYQPLPTCDTD
ncbi:cell wall protein DAN4-like [Parambassis ranga]|uniref:Cell wall protein DAN4-like n=1 Tax=Parambassis ranga TaxID=210632 RepID=A0A6P7HWM4_9TELE|nr:cell wall protein DAN4-like [Parambassis ranga]